MVKPAAGYRPLAYSSPEAVQTTGTVAVLRHNVVLGPWMHVGSTVQHFSAARIGDELTANAVVAANYERKGHRFVELDVLVYAGRERPVAKIGHIAIYRPRQLANAA